MSRTELVPLDVDLDVPLVHGWVTHPRSAFWQMQGVDVDDVRTAYAAIEARPDHAAWLGRVDGAPAFLAETYDPRTAEEPGLAPFAERLGLRPGDLGMHVLVAPPEGPVEPGFTRLVFAAVMRHCFAGTVAGRRVARVVVEPDVDNVAIARLNAEAGFVVDRHLTLPGKRAALSFCTRAAFEGSDLA